MYEEKVDGWQMLAYKDRDRVRLMSRNGRDHTRRFADIATAILELSARTLVLDGEVAGFDQQLRSRFNWLREPDLGAVSTPPIYIVFDVMLRDRRDLARLPLSARRIHLEDVIAGAELVLPVRAWPQTASTRGPRLAATATRAWSPRTRPACTKPGRRGGG